ncbi:hypothetical protein [Komagataeibacter rhaeticus]|uniref:Uncharacterized protein n=1 Tax=Komagataeibacter rhaeticus TaxID=215221 RepID=A0A858JLZ8_9PROT|nr:hypothetical protein [Komagataeibacter rhaeticus]QIP36694.1 hypothetical protein GWK63_15675 [Komagataeibacter rhaeticus]QOC46458.1 hypothetical protein ICJ78_15685 [Komagataeibacter rhaeticus]WPP23234.1 hypothetical protein SCD25_07155 [Komagataeibacter rhaeticus]
MSSDIYVSPLLVGLATPRTHIPDIGGYYSDELDVWVEDGPMGVSPIVQRAQRLTEIVTKTAAAPETDDQGNNLVELVTKTESFTEKDDCVDSLV